MITSVVSILSLVVLIILLFIISKKREEKETTEEITLKIRDIENILNRIDPLIREEFLHNREEMQKNFRETREELSNALRSLGEVISGTLEKRLYALQEENTKKLDEMRAVVDEKLHSTLEKRLSESFNLVSERLKQVHEGLGEMRSLATDVGDLKKVLANVKTRGILGEIQLGSILESILAPEQYEKNIPTIEGSNEFVEYAIKMPGGEKPVYLPIDSKFPIEVYYRLIDAYEKGKQEDIQRVYKELETVIKKCAKDIRDKYVSPPSTTDFAILFVPVEGLYAEIVRQPGLFETLQREYKVCVVGPSTFAVFLNSLYMGFRTLTIQKRTSEVWRILADVKKEFDKFGEVLKKAQEKIEGAGKDIETLVGTRTRQIQAKLKSVEGLKSETVEELPEE
ncbi:MAG TPA: DNA recombination protein RmuC [bacterium]|mgnify:CR=1|nr:DNA recombination protein RmuC [bacterium]HPP29927.1 DNA recombination protein RmuC [bacterium]